MGTVGTVIDSTVWMGRQQVYVADKTEVSKYT